MTGRAPDLERDGTHPVIYPGFGGHASYARCGPQIRPVLSIVGGNALGPPLVDQVLCPPGQAHSASQPVGSVFRFGPDTPLVDLPKDGWACWPGRLGNNGDNTAVSCVGPGPQAPLWQQENSQSATCGGQPPPPAARAQ